MMESSRSEPAATGIIQTMVAPREVVNADSVYLVTWSVPDHTLVEPGTAVCEVETSKAIVAIEAEHRGYLRHRAVAGEEVLIGGVLGYITTQADTPLPMAPRAAGPEPSAPMKISAKAKRMIEELGLDLALFSCYRFVREREVLEIAASFRSGAQPQRDLRGEFRLEPLRPIQRRVARVMEESAARTPAAYMQRVIDLALVRERANEIMRTSKVLVSPVDLLVAAVAKAGKHFPSFNGFLTSDYQLQLFEQVNVGVAVDVEMDLYVVVVKNVAAKSPEAIAKELRTLQYLAQRRRLTIDHLTGGTITVTSMLGHGIHGFQPMLYPQQAAIVGIAESEPDSTRAALTLGFDHRIANGSQAAAFLGAIDNALRGE